MAVVMITGCSSGIGLLTALSFARRGDRVYATMRDTRRAGDLLAAASKEDLEVVVRKLDVTEQGAAEKCVGSIIDAEGRMDVLVNNAGLNHLGSVEFLPEELLRLVFETNFFGPLRTIRAVLPVMRAQGSGAIVNVSSGGGRIPGTPIGLAYSTSKHAQSTMTDCLAFEVEDLGIRVVSVEPGFYRTTFLERSIRGGEEATPYAELERRMWTLIDTAYRTAPDPQPVADAIVTAATTAGPVHVLLGEEAKRLFHDASTLTEAEWRAMIREWVFSGRNA